MPIDKVKIGVIFMLVIVVAIIGAYLIFVDLPQRVEYNRTHFCDKYLNPDETPLPPFEYYTIPDQCVNRTRMYPDETFERGNGFVLEYVEYPESGRACVYSSNEDLNFWYYQELSFACKGEFLGRYVINDTHRFFERFKNPLPTNVSFSNNATHWSFSNITSNTTVS